MSKPTAFQTCACEVEESSARARAASPLRSPHQGQTMAQFHDGLLEERAQAIREGRWFYGYRPDRETYVEFQKRALAEIGRDA
jgi:hypothetical protein